LQEHGGWSGESVARRKNGSSFDAKISASVVSDSTGKPSAMLATFVDITEQRKAEDVIRLRLRLLEFAVTHSLEEVMRNALDEIGRITGSPIGFYHFVNVDQKTLLLQTWSTRTLKEFCQAEGRGLHYSIDETGVWVDCVCQRRPVIHNDYYALPHRKGLPPSHAEVIRELVVPILRKGRVVSILGIGNKPSDYDEKDVELTAYIADIVWEIVEGKRAEGEIFRLSSFPQLNPNPVLEADASGAITFYNTAALNILTRLGLNDPHIFIPANLDIAQELKNGKATQVYREVRIKNVIIEEMIHFAREFDSVRIYANDIRLPNYVMRHRC
jgi:PAS domain-containing protein